MWWPLFFQIQKAGVIYFANEFFYFRGKSFPTMKKIFVSFLILGINSAISAQVFNRVIAESDEQGGLHGINATLVQGIGSQTFIVNSVFHSDSGKIGVIQRLDAQGRTVLSTDIRDSGYFPSAFITGFYVLPDSSLLLYGRKVPDCGMPNANVFIQRYDQNLNLLSSLVSPIGDIGMI